MLGRVDHAPGHLVEKGGQGGDLGLGLVGLAVAGAQDGKRLGKPTLIKSLRALARKSANSGRISSARGGCEAAGSVSTAGRPTAGRGAAMPG